MECELFDVMGSMPSIPVYRNSAGKAQRGVSVKRAKSYHGAENGVEWEILIKYRKIYFLHV